MKPKYLHSDNHPSDQPTDSYRYALNALVSNDRFINESGNIECAELPEGYSILGHVQGIDSTIVLIASLTGSQIGRIKDCEYIVELDEVDLNFSLLHQMTSVKFRVRNGCEEEIYFTDDYNPPRAVNLSKLNDYYVGGVFDASKINLLYDVQIPVINVSVNEYGGSVKMGTYNFAIRFLDEDLNATHWIDTTPVVAIYDESIYAPYTQIDGGLTLEVDPVNGLPETSKSITLELSNIDDKFTYYQIGIIAANAASGRPSSYKASPAIPITQTEYVYTGTTSDMTDLTAEEIAIPKTDIDTVRTMEVASNKLLLAGLKGKQVDFAALQRAASLIYTTYEIEEVDRKDAVALGNAKNPNTYYEKMSEMAGEVRAYGIVFLFDDGYETPPCHIAGRPANRDPRSCALISGGNTQIPAPEISNQWDTSTIANWSSELQHIVFNEDDYDGSLKRYQIYNTATKDTDTTGLMGYYQVETATYPDIRDCNGISIWGVDACGNELTGQNIRHHRMPDRRLQPQYDYDNEVIRLIGVRFHNITYPDSRIVGHYIVAAERTEENKTVLDTGVSFRYEECSDLTAYTYMHHLVGTEPYHYIAHPRFLYNGELLRGYIKVESSQHITTQTYATDIKKLTDVGQDDIYFGFRRIICDGTNAVTQHNYAITDTMKIAGASKDTLGTVDVANMSMTNNVNLFKTVDVLPTHSYVSLMVYKDVYKNIFNLRYYKIHPNMLTNSSSNLIFGGDTFINELKIMDSKIRDINPGMWGEIAAIAGIIAGLAVTILTLGAAAPAGAIIAAVAVTAATAAAIGITANAVAIHTKAIRDGIYEDCLADVALDNAVQNEFGLLDGLDKKIIIHTEYFRGLFIDSGINLDLRHENNDECGTYYKGGDVFRYLQNRLVFYNEDESKFMVKPVFCPEVYVYNRDYSRKNKEKSYTSLPIAFDYCSECLNVFPNRVAWSQTSLDEQQSDAFRIFLVNNVQDLSAAYGPITNLISKAEKLYITTTDMLFYVPENLQERVTTDFATYIGTGEYLGIPPREVVDSDLGSIGCLDSFSIINTPFGTPILDSKEGIIYLLSN